MVIANCLENQKSTDLKVGEQDRIVYSFASLQLLYFFVFDGVDVALRFMFFCVRSATVSHTFTLTHQGLGNTRASRLDPKRMFFEILVLFVSVESC